MLTVKENQVSKFRKQPRVKGHQICCFFGSFFFGQLFFLFLTDGRTDEKNLSETATAMSFEPKESEEHTPISDTNDDEKVDEHGEGFEDSSLSSLSDGDLCDLGDGDDDDMKLDAMGLMLGMSLAEMKQQQAAMKQLLAMMRHERVQPPPPPPLTEEERALLESPLPQPLETPDLAGVAKYIADGHAKNIIVMSFVFVSSPMTHARTLLLFIFSLKMSLKR